MRRALEAALGRTIKAAIAAVACFGAKAAADDPTAGGRDQAAHRLILWVDWSSVADLTDSELDLWKSRGVDGFVLQVRHLRGMGGTNDFTSAPDAPLRGAEHDIQRRLRDARIAARAKDRGMKLYLGLYCVNYWNTRTPLVEWFDEDGWANSVVPKCRDIAGAAKVLGFAGLAFDLELYPQKDRAQTACWSWSYPGNSRAESAVRAKVKERGAQLMRTMVGAYPDLEIVAYCANFPECWAALVQEVINHANAPFAADVTLDFFDGLSSVEGYRGITLWEAVFYKTPHLSGATWDTAFTYEYNRLYALLSRRFSNWAYASRRFHESPFAWIDAGPSAFEAARPPATIATQLAAFRRWGMNEEYGVYCYQGLRFDYTAYIPAMVAGSEPGTVDSRAPTLAITFPSGDVTTSRDSFDLTGFARDDLAIKAVRWTNARGGSGTARLTWKVDSGDYRNGYHWHMDWNAAVSLNVGPNPITIEAEDIKGLTADVRVTVTRV